MWFHSMAEISNNDSVSCPSDDTMGDVLNDFPNNLREVIT